MIEGFTDGGLALLGLLVFLAGFVDALAGGGGLITLPAYLASGLPPALLLGTNKLSSSIGTVASALRYLRHRHFDVKGFLPVIAAALAGSWLGARLALLLDPAWIRPILIAALPVVAYGVLSKKHFGREDLSHEFDRRGLLARELGVALPIGAYDGFFGPGTGTFFTLALARFCRYDLLRATTACKLLNLASNVAALAAFLWAGRVHVALGASMGLLSVAGHYAGSAVGVKKGAEVIRPMIALVCAGLFLKLLSDAWRG